MFRWQTMAGVAIGFTAGLVVLSHAGRAERKPPAAGPILSECDGPLREVVVHYEPGASAVVLPVYRDFLGSLGADVRVHVVCPEPRAFDELVSSIGALRCRLLPVVVHHPMTAWSRDRWVALTPARPGGPTTLLSPRGEAGSAIWPGRAGDERLGWDLAATLGPSVRARRSALYFDGGDFLADGENVFVIPRVLQRNLQRTVLNREALLDELSTELRRRVVVLEESPDHHAGMFMASAGRGVLLVGDPSLGKPFLPLDLPGAGPSDGTQFEPDFSDPTQRSFDAVASQCSAMGYRVVRIPTVPGRDGRTFLTYVNVILDQHGERRIVYLPVYRGAEQMNSAARAVWEGLGYEVRPVDCTSSFRHFGCLHCLVNVLGR